MQIVKLALAIFLFQIIFFLCVSGFSDEISLSVIITNFWSKFVQGSISYHFENYSDTNFEVWIYFFFSVTRCLCNFFTAKKKTRRSVDGIQTLQFLLSSTLSCYLFFLDLWLTKSKGFNSCFVILPILSFISMEVDFNLLSRWIGFGVANLFQIFCALGCISMFFVNKGSYWLFVPYILIPGFDIIRTLFQSSRPKCDSSMYIEHLLPSFLLIAYIKPLGSAYMLFYPPETKVIDTCGVFLALGLLLVAFEALIKRKYSQDLKIERFLITSDFPREDSCSICLESLTEAFYNQNCYKENTIYTPNPIKGCWNRFMKLIKTKFPEKKHYISKTPCFHYFHEKCLQKWFNTRYECPYCRKELMQS